MVNGLHSYRAFPAPRHLKLVRTKWDEHRVTQRPSCILLTLVHYTFTRLFTLPACPEDHSAFYSECSRIESWKNNPFSLVDHWRHRGRGRNAPTAHRSSDIEFGRSVWDNESPWLNSCWGGHVAWQEDSTGNALKAAELSHSQHQHTVRLFHL